MKRRLLTLSIAAFMLSPVPAYAHHHDRDGRDRNGNDGSCQSGGCGNKQDRCRDSGDNCKNWSPTFDHSPIMICVQPGSCSDKGGNQK